MKFWHGPLNSVALDVSDWNRPLGEQSDILKLSQFITLLSSTNKQNKKKKFYICQINYRLKTKIT